MLLCYSLQDTIKQKLQVQINELNRQLDDVKQSISVIEDEVCGDFCVRLGVPDIRSEIILNYN